MTEKAEEEVMDFIIYIGSNLLAVSQTREK